MHKENAAKEAASGNRWSSQVKKGVIMDLVIVAIGAGDNVAKVGVFCCVLWNIEFWVLDLEMGLGKGLRDMGEDKEEQLEVWSHGEGYNPHWFLYSLSTAKALPRFASNSKVCLVSE